MSIYLSYLTYFRRNLLFLQVEDLWLVKDKNTKASKGIVYVKFSKASEAALAMENLHGKALGNDSKPIKV